ncbi:MAG TPA: cytochrome C, partial [Chloroflexi bacterium]|nr:cytochrome C [Chloroflexota bacterium]
MRRRIAFHIRNFFFPPAEASWAVRALPYAVLGVLTLVVLIAGAYAWDYTNSPEFCGTACHTMPPEFTAYLVSPHARVDCVDCHIGRGFIATRITRKAGDVKHIVATAFKTYEFPIRAESLRPARETCEKCHFPQKFSDDSLREIKRFLPDTENTPQSIYLTLKTGGGSKREGLG